MVVALATDLQQDWLDKLNSILGEKAMVVPVVATAAPDLAQRLPVSLLVANAEPLVTDRVLAYLRVLQTCPQAVFVCIAPEDVREQIRNERLFTPDFWLQPHSSRPDVEESITQALHKASLLASTQPPTIPVHSPAPSEPAVPLTTASPTLGEQTIWRQLLAAMAGSTDTDRLLAAYVEATVQLVHCASHCFLWQEQDNGLLTVKRCQGLPPEIAQHGRLSPTDALAGWYRNNCRALTRQELTRWPDRTQALAVSRELDVFRGQVAIPLIISGRLAGLLVLGDKIVGEPYSHADLEQLFVLTSYIALHLENTLLQNRVRETQAYMEASLASMRCGLITLGNDQRIAVCNPYAARVLGIKPEELAGADLRVLPSPLGDYLFAASRSPEAAVTAENVRLASRDLRVRVTTSTLLDHTSQPAGGVLLLEDITGPVAQAAEASRQDTLNTLARIIGRLAHDVRTPLTAIKIYGELMNEPDDLQELSRFWRETVNPELERLDHLIAEQIKLLEQAEPQFELVNLEHLIKGVMDKISKECEPTAAPLLKVIPPLPSIVADPGPTHDALHYLLRYLCQHGSSPVGVVVDEQRKGPLPNVRVRMRTAVTSGFDIGSILDPLAALQLPDGDLGPAIGRQLIDKQGGTVEVRNGDGYSEFRVLFPVNLVDPSSSAKGERDV